MNPAFIAGIEVARQFGIDSDQPELIQETNHTVVWLRPHEVIAKVGTRGDAQENLAREFEVATCLFARGAPVARPLLGSFPTKHVASECFVTLWQRFARDDTQVLEVDIGRSLKRVHAELLACDVSLPSFMVGIEKARRALFDQALMSALSPADLDFLRLSFDRSLARVRNADFPEQPLHGEPHAGNWISTSLGVRWLDFENACLGPLEWDLAFLSDEARQAFPDADDDLLRVVRSLVSACVATWCGVQARFPEMRAFGAEHLNQLRAATSNE